MIVFGDRRVVVDTRRRLLELREEVRGAAGAGAHDKIVGILVAFGELEAGVVDRLCGERDGPAPVERAWRRVALQVGHAVRSSWRGDLAEARNWLRGVEWGLGELTGLEQPSAIEVGVHEGYAYYALYPETYLEAAAAFFREVGARKVVCIGVRSIGAGLSAVVGAELEAAGCAVRSFTVRPRGHPFDRQLACSAELEGEIREAEGCHFLIVDEGPGLSGSSLASVARWLLDLGVPEDRILLFPSWRTDGSGLISERARALWPRFRQYVSSFESCWLESGRLGEGLPAGDWRDLSGGRWRSLWYGSEADYPAVQPQHERRKYLLVPRSAGSDQEGPLLIKFAGLGHYGRERVQHLELLAGAGFSPVVQGARHGFSISEFSSGRPVGVGEVDGVLLDFMARYLAFRRVEFPSDRVAPFDDLLGMIRHNALAGLGEEVAGELGWLAGYRELVLARGTVAIDGRMLPHKWLRVPGGYLKVDGVDHHDDHFFPGCQDIAWDLAGAAIECTLGREAERALVDSYRVRSGDNGVDAVLPFYQVAYLAFRLGYTTLAAQSVGAGAEGRRLGEAARRYRLLLQRDLQVNQWSRQGG